MVALGLSGLQISELHPTRGAGHQWEQSSLKVHPVRSVPDWKQPAGKPHNHKSALKETGLGPSLW